MGKQASHLTLDQIKNRATISLAELGSLFGIDEDSASKAVRSGQVPAFRIGRLWRIPVPKLLAMLGHQEPVGQQGSAEVVVEQEDPALSDGNACVRARAFIDAQEGEFRFSDVMRGANASSASVNAVLKAYQQAGRLVRVSRGRYQRNGEA